MSVAQYSYLVMFAIFTPLWFVGLGILATGIGLCYYFIMKAYTAKMVADHEIELIDSDRKTYNTKEPTC